MSWSEPAIGYNFRVKVFVIDNTYRDDGSRQTIRSFDYATLTQALAFMTDTVKAGVFKLTSEVTRELFSRRIDADDVILYRWSDGKWHQLNNTDIITMLGQIAG